MAYEDNRQNDLLEKDHPDPDPGSVEAFLANCPDLLREGVLPTLTRLANDGRVELLTRDVDSFTIRLQTHPSTQAPKQ